MQTDRGSRGIAICDAKQETLAELEKLIMQICKDTRQDVQMYQFHSGETLLEAIAKVSIVFLGIQLGEMDGIEIGRIIKQKKPECRIILVTGNESRYKDAFRIQAFRFVTKPFEREEVEEALEAALNTFVGTESIELYRARTLYEVRQKDIKYVKAFNGYTEFAVQESIFRKDISMDALKEQLDMRTFYRINRQYIVNMHWIQKYENGTLLLANQEFKVSRRKRSDFEKVYMDYEINYRKIIF